MLTWLALAQQGSAAAAGARRRSGAGTTYSITMVDDGSGTGCLYSALGDGSLSPTTFNGATIQAVNSSGELGGAANIIVSGAVAADFITSVTINGVTLLTATAEHTSGSSTSWEWLGETFVGNTPGTYVMVVT